MLGLKRCTAALAAAGLIAAVAALAFDYDDTNLRDPMVRWMAGSTNPPAGAIAVVVGDTYAKATENMSNLVAGSKIEAVVVGWTNALVCINDRLLGVNKTPTPKPEELPFPGDPRVFIYAITTGEIVFIQQNVQYSVPSLTALPATQETKKP